MPSSPPTPWACFSLVSCFQVTASSSCSATTLCLPWVEVHATLPQAPWAEGAGVSTPDLVLATPIWDSTPPCLSLMLRAPNRTWHRVIRDQGWVDQGRLSKAWSVWTLQRVKEAVSVMAETWLSKSLEWMRRHSQQGLNVCSTPGSHWATC